MTERNHLTITGRCHCGSVTYQAILDPAEVSICHCSDCQRLTGTAFRITASVPAGDFVLTGGEPRRYVRLGDNGATRLQFFCPQCGSPIYTTGTGRDAATVGIRAGTIDQRAQLVPQSQIWCDSALPWLDMLSGLERHAKD
jgi:hypothetical protein